MLLKEKIVIADTYKAEYKEARKKLLSADHIEHIPVTKSADQDVAEIAQDMSRIWVQSFQMSREQERFPEYLHLAIAFSKYLWEKSNSFTYLVFNAFGIDKFSPMFEIIQKNIDLFGLSDEFEIVDSEGRLLSTSIGSHLMLRQRYLLLPGWVGDICGTKF